MARRQSQRERTETLRKRHPNILWVLVHGADALAVIATIYLFVVIAATYLP